MTTAELAGAWHLDAYAGTWLSLADLTSLTGWMDANGMERATAEHPIDVRTGAITYGSDRSGPSVRQGHRDIRTVTVALRTPPPDVYQPIQTDALQAALKTIGEHEWSSGFGGTCVTCSTVTVNDAGQVMCRRDDAVRWPCPLVREAMLGADLPVPPPIPGQDTVRILGDCLAERSHAAVFGSQVLTTDPGVAR